MNQGNEAKLESSIQLIKVLYIYCHCMACEVTSLLSSDDFVV